MLHYAAGKKGGMGGKVPGTSNSCVGELGDMSYMGIDKK